MAGLQPDWSKATLLRRRAPPGVAGVAAGWHCLAENSVADLRSCITHNANCADVCTATAAVLSRQTGYDADVTRGVLEACVTACTACGDECAHHGEMGMEHCRVCAEACRRCADACRALLSATS